MNLIARIGLLWCICLATPAWAHISIQDDYGETLHFEAPPARIISLIPHATELLFSIGAGDQLIAVDPWSDFPAAAKKLPRVGDAQTLHIERILALKPDLVIIWQPTSDSRRILQLRRLGVKVFASAPKNFEDIANTAKKWLVLSKHPSKTALHQFQQKHAQLRQTYAKKTTMNVFVQISHSPITTIGRDQFISHALTVCGAKNIFRDQKLASFPVHPEQLIQRQPDLIIGFSGDPPPKQAGINIPYETISPNLLARPSFRLIEGTEIMCKKIDELRRKSENSRSK